MADCFAVGDNNFVDKDHSANIIAYKFILSLGHCDFEIAVAGPLVSSRVSSFVVRNVILNLLLKRAFLFLIRNEVLNHASSKKFWNVHPQARMS